MSRLTASLRDSSPACLLPRSMRRYLKASGLPDLPEVRRMLRLAWLDGFTFRTSSAIAEKLAYARLLSRRAVAEYERGFATVTEINCLTDSDVVHLSWHGGSYAWGTSPGRYRMGDKVPVDPPAYRGGNISLRGKAGRG